jgi:hypothetical protein
MERRMRACQKLRVVLFACVSACTLAPSIANATDPSYSGAAIAIAQSTTDSTAHWVAVNPGSVNGACNGALYIPYADKEMFAVALTASANNRDVFIYYDAGASSKTIPFGSNFSTTCRIKAIQLD